MNGDLTATLLRATLESTADGILVVTRDRNTPIYNQKFLQMWGISETLMQTGMAEERLQFLGAQTKDPQGFVNRVWELFRDRPEETAFDLLEFKDGRIFERYSQPLKNDDQILGRVWSFRDITQQRHTEEALSRQATAIRSSVDGVGILDANQNYLYLNEAHVQIYGYDSTQELIGTCWTRMYDDAELQRFKQEVMPEFSRTGHWQGEAIGKRQDGSLFPQEVSLSAIQGGGLVCIVRDITIRKRAEVALKQAEERYRSIFENAVVGIYQTTPDGRYLSLNPTLARMHGYQSPAEMMSALTDIQYQLYVNPERREEFKRCLAENGAVTEFEAQVYRQDGSIIWVAESARTVRDEAGNILYYEGSSIDITDRKRTEAALRESEEILRLTLDFNRIGIWNWDMATGEMTASEETLRLIGLEPGAVEVSYQLWRNVVHPEDIERVEQAIAQSLQTRADYEAEYRVIYPDGNTHWIVGRGRAVYDELGQPVRMLGVLICITDRKRAEEQIQENLSLLDGVINGTNDLIFAKNLKGQYILVNRAFSEVFSQSIEAITGLTDFDIFPANVAEQIQMIDQRIVEGDTHRTFEENVPIHGEIRTFFTTKTPYRDAQGNIVGLIGIARDISERKQAEEAMRRSEAKYRNIFENSHVGIGRTRLGDGLFLEVNQRYAEIMGFDTATDLVGRRFSSEFYANPADRERILAKLYEQGEVRNFEEQLRRPDGSTGWGLLSLRLNQEEGCIDFVIADISDRKHLEEELRQSQQFLDSIIDNIPLALFTKDIRHDFRYALINRNADQILGFSREGAIGKNDHDLLPKELADNYRAQDKAAIEHRGLLEIPEYPVKTDTGSILARSLKLPLFDSQGNPTHLLCISEDITERKRQENALRLIVEGTASKTGDDFFRACVRYLAEVLQVHCAFVTTWANEQHTRVRTLAFWIGNEFGDNFEIDLEGTPCEHVVTGKQLYFYPEALSALFPYDPHLSLLQAESYLGIPLLNLAGEMLGYLAVTDVKPMQPDPGRELILKIFAARAGAELERMQAEASLRVAKDAAEAANRAKSGFLANMSHELRTPLNAILGFSQLMERDNSLTPRQRQSLAIINRSGEHLLALINDVLEMSKIEAGRTVLHPSPFDLHQLLHTLHDMFQFRAETKRLSLQCAIAPDLPRYVMADAGKLRQILMNLLSNAIKFTQHGGVVLKVRSEASGVSSLFTPHSPLLTLHFEVEDTGCGIALEEIDRLFQPFVQTTSGILSKEGTGLGLAISRQFAQLMGGDIYFTSTLGQGSIFCVDVQVNLATSADIVPTLPSRQVLGLVPNQPPYRILVADDRPENRDLISQLLQTVGFEVHTADHGAEAIAQWQSWRPHLIWMDMRMPVMSGYEATKRIRDVEARALVCNDKTTKIIALTASAFEEQHASVLAVGCNDLVIKPFREQLIFEKMAEHLGVQYIYAEDPEPESEAPPPYPPIPLSPYPHPFFLPPSTPPPLTAMPATWIAQLRQAALAVDTDEIWQLIEQIPDRDRPLADTLSDLLKRYDYDGILDLTQSL